MLRVVNRSLRPIIEKNKQSDFFKRPIKLKNENPKLNTRMVSNVSNKAIFSKCTQPKL